MNQHARMLEALRDAIDHERILLFKHRPAQAAR